jgi:hypothetical protein
LVAPCFELVELPAGLLDPPIELALLPAALPVAPGVTVVCANALPESSRTLATIKTFFMTYPLG